MLSCAFGPPTKIASGLYQAGYPLYGSPKAAGFAAVALCAREYQPSESKFKGSRVIYAPMDDRAIDSDILYTAEVAAERVMAHVMAGDRVLVTCAMGKNRSGLVVGLCLVNLYNISGAEAVEIIQGNRPGALSNDTFVAYLETL